MISQQGLNDSLRLQFFNQRLLKMPQCLSGCLITGGISSDLSHGCLYEVNKLCVVKSHFDQFHHWKHNMSWVPWGDFFKVSAWTKAWQHTHTHSNTPFYVSQSNSVAAGQKVDRLKKHIFAPEFIHKLWCNRIKRCSTPLFRPSMSTHRYQVPIPLVLLMYMYVYLIK